MATKYVKPFFWTYYSRFMPMRSTPTRSTSHEVSSQQKLLMKCDRGLSQCGVKRCTTSKKCPLQRNICTASKKCPLQTLLSNHAVTVTSLLLKQNQLTIFPLVQSVASSWYSTVHSTPPAYVCVAWQYEAPEIIQWNYYGYHGPRTNSHVEGWHS